MIINVIYSMKVNALISVMRFVMLLRIDNATQLMKGNVPRNTLQSVRRFKTNLVIQLTIVSVQHLWRENVERKSLRSEKPLQRSKIGKLMSKYVVKSPRRNVRMFRGSNVQSGMSRRASLLRSKCVVKFTTKKFAKTRLLKFAVTFLKNIASMLLTDSAIRPMLMTVTLSRGRSVMMSLKLLKGRYSMKSVRMSLLRIALISQQLSVRIFHVKLVMMSPSKYVGIYQRNSAPMCRDSLVETLLANLVLIFLILCAKR